MSKKNKKRGSKSSCNLYVKGMHCPSCEILIENKIKEEFGVDNIKASTVSGKITFEQNSNKPSIEELNNIFKKHNYTFSLEKDIQKESSSTLNGILVALLAIVLFIILERSGISSAVSITKESTIIGFLLFGLIAGFSSCGALVGGIILSMSKQWSRGVEKKNKAIPLILFNLGRILSYTILGGVLGYVGSLLNISLEFSSILSIGISVFMLVLAMQMLGVKYFQRFQIALPKSITSKISNESNFNIKLMPFIMGALTFFLPCGFTLTAQTIAITTGSFLGGSLIMGMFALGTLPALAMIGITSMELNSNPKLSGSFSKIAGILVLFFALYNINAQFNVLGISNISDLSTNANESKSKNVETIGEKQIIKMEASARGYTPNYFKIKKGVPVVWEITDKGVSGCTNAIIARGLFDGDVKIIKGKTATKEFTPTKAGRYKFSCWMGMVTGIIEVVE